jgi:hypothetical protein
VSQPAHDLQLAEPIKPVQNMRLITLLILIGALGLRSYPFVLATRDIQAAKTLVDTDPVIQKGEMIAEYHSYFGSAALMLINELHGRIDRP